MIDYRAFAAAGLPLGSGCGESAHKTLLQARLKGSGMQWTLPAIAAMIALRLTLGNARWDGIWPRVGPRGRVAHRERVAQRRRPRRPAPASSPPVSCPALPSPAPAIRPLPAAPLGRDRRPAATDAWRRALIRSPPRPITQM